MAAAGRRRHAPRRATGRPIGAGGSTTNHGAASASCPLRNDDVACDHVSHIAGMAAERRQQKEMAASSPGGRCGSTSSRSARAGCRRHGRRRAHVARITAAAAGCHAGRAHGHRDCHRLPETVRLREQAGFQGLDRAFSAPFDPDPLFEPKHTGGRLRKIGGYDFHQGCLGLAVRPTLRTWVDLLGGEPGRAGQVQGARLLGPLVVLERVGNSDNIGGTFRHAAALGASAVLLSPGCSDPLYRKAVRTSTGATLHLPFAVEDGDWPEAIQRLRERGRHVVGLTPHERAIPLDEYRPPPEAAGVALLLGNEGDGLSPGALAMADVWVVFRSTLRSTRSTSRLRRRSPCITSAPRDDRCVADDAQVCRSEAILWHRWSGRCHLYRMKAI